MKVVGVKASEVLVRDRRIKFSSFINCPANLQPPLVFGDGNVVDLGIAPPHQTRLVKFPMFVAVRTKPFIFRVVPFVFKAHKNPIFGKRPQLFH